MVFVVGLGLRMCCVCVVVFWSAVCLLLFFCVCVGGERVVRFVAGFFGLWLFVLDRWWFVIVCCVCCWFVVVSVPVVGFVVGRRVFGWYVVVWLAFVLGLLLIGLCLLRLACCLCCVLLMVCCWLVRVLFGLFLFGLCVFFV